MSSLQPMVVIGVGSTGQLAVNRFRQYLYAIFQDDLSSLKKVLRLMTMETADGTAIDPGLRNDRILISTSMQAADSLTVEQLRRKLGAPLNFLNSLGIKDTDPCNTFGGAGNVRYKGKLSLWFHWDAIKQEFINGSNSSTSNTELLNKHIKVHAADSMRDSIDISPDGHIVYIIGALGGGTCSGSFIDLAYLVQRQFGEESTHVYGIFAVPQAPWPALDTRVNGNFYGSLKELSYYASGKYMDVFPTDGFKQSSRPPYEKTFLVQWDIDDGNGMDLQDRVACKLLFDFCGMEPLSRGIRRDHTSKDRNAQTYLATFDLAGMIYPKYDLVMCAASRLAMEGVNTLYNEGEVKSLEGEKSEAPRNFTLKGKDWLDEEIKQIFERFYQLVVGERPSLAGIKHMAEILANETDPDKCIMDFVTLARQVFKDQVRPLLEGDSGDKEKGGLGPEFLKKCSKLFQDRRNVLVVQCFTDGVEDYIDVLRKYWEDNLNATTMEAAKKDILKSLGFRSIPEREVVIYNFLKQDVLDSLIAEVLLKGNFLSQFREHYTSRVRRDRSKEDLLKYYQQSMEKNINQLSMAFKTLQKVDRFGNVLQPKQIEAEMEKLTDKQNPEDYVVGDLWLKWMEVKKDPNAEDPVLPFLFKCCVQSIFKKNVERESMINWDEAIDRLKDRLRDFEKDINRGKGMFTPSSKVHEGHDGVHGVPKFLIAPTSVQIPDDVSLKFGNANEPRNGKKSLSFLEDFMVFYEERTHFSLEDLKFWSESKQAFESYHKNYECQTIPFDSPNKMAKLEATLRNYQERPDLERNLPVWIKGLEDFLQDFIIEWSSAGTVMGVSDLGQEMLGDYLDSEAVGGFRIDLSLPYEQSLKVKIPISPDCRLAFYISDNREYLVSFLRMMQSVIRDDMRDNLIEIFNEKVRRSYAGRGIDASEENDRMNLYFIDTPDRPCLLKAVQLLSGRSDLLVA